MTFDVMQELHTITKYDWQYNFEIFCVCRHCYRSTIFVVSQNVDSDKSIVHKHGLMKIAGAINVLMDIDGIISIKDRVRHKPPEHVPERIGAVFTEGATCHSMECWNAAGAMFRACIDLATAALLPAHPDRSIDQRTRMFLAPRLRWLFDNKKLPDGLRDLSTCIREDGNDGVHQVNLSRDDAADLLDFTRLLLERLYTEPERLKLADQRRAQRRSPPPAGATP